MTAWVKTIAFVQNGEILMAGCDDGKVLFWDVASGTLRDEIQALDRGAESVLSPDGRVLVVGNGGKTLVNGLRGQTLQLWDMWARKPLPVLDGFDAVSAVAFSPDGKV